MTLLKPLNKKHRDFVGYQEEIRAIFLDMLKHKISEVLMS